MIDLSLPASVRVLSTPESEQLAREYPDLPTPENCITCKGKKSFQWWDDPASAERQVVTYDCPCRDQWILHRFLLNSGIPRSYQVLGWSDLTWIEDGALVKVAEYLDRRDDYVDAGFGMILFRNKGTGKTLLMALLLKDLLAHGHDCYFTTFNALLDVFTGGWHDTETKARFHKRIKNAGVLGLDDPGKEIKSRVALPGAVLDELIRHRVSDLRPTFITTNDTLGQFGVRYGEYVMSLLQERATTYEFTGTDSRPLANNRLKDEVRMGLTRPLVLG